MCICFPVAIVVTAVEDVTQQTADKLDSPVREHGNHPRDAEAKLNWIKICLVGRAQKAFQSLPEVARADYDRMKTTLMERFEPASKRELYNTELQVWNKRQNEGWGEFRRETATSHQEIFPRIGCKESRTDGLDPLFKSFN